MVIFHNIFFGGFLNGKNISKIYMASFYSYVAWQIVVFRHDIFSYVAWQNVVFGHAIF